MAGTLNKVILIGRLGKDPEIKATNGGGSFAMMSLATEETWRDKNTQEKKKKTEWHRVVCFNEKLAEIIGKYVRKGALVYVEGQLTTRKWTDNAGVEKYVTEIVLPKFGGVMTMLSTPEGSQDSGQQSTAGNTQGAARGRSQADLDDDIPF